MYLTRTSSQQPPTARSSQPRRRWNQQDRHLTGSFSATVGVVEAVGVGAGFEGAVVDTADWAPNFFVRIAAGVTLTETKGSHSRLRPVQRRSQVDTFPYCSSLVTMIETRYPNDVKKKAGARVSDRMIEWRQKQRRNLTKTTKIEMKNNRLQKGFAQVHE